MSKIRDNKKTLWIRKGRNYILSEENSKVRYLKYDSISQLNSIINRLEKKEYVYDVKHFGKVVQMWSNHTKYGANVRVPPGRCYSFSNAGYPLGENLYEISLREDEETFT